MTLTFLTLDAFSFHDFKILFLSWLKILLCALLTRFFFGKVQFANLSFLRFIYLNLLLSNDVIFLLIVLAFFFILWLKIRCCALQIDLFVVGSNLLIKVS